MQTTLLSHTPFKEAEYSKKIKVDFFAHNVFQNTN